MSIFPDTQLAGDATNQIPSEMTIFAGAQCPNPTEFRIRGTELWVLLAEDDHPYTPMYRPSSSDHSREVAVEAITAAIGALEGARDRLRALPALRERL